MFLSFGSVTGGGLAMSDRLSSMPADDDRIALGALVMSLAGLLRALALPRRGLAYWSILASSTGPRFTDTLARAKRYKAQASSLGRNFHLIEGAPQVDSHIYVPEVLGPNGEGRNEQEAYFILYINHSIL